MRRAYRGTMCSENWRCFRGSINYVTMGGEGRKDGRAEGRRKMDIRRVCTARVSMCVWCVRAYVSMCTRWSKSTVLETCDIRSYAESLTPKVKPLTFQLDAPVIWTSKKKEKEREIKKNSSIIPVAKCSIDSRKNYLSHKSLHTERYVLHVSKCYLLQLFHKIIYLLTSSYVYLQIYSKFIISIKFIEHIFWVPISLNTSIKNIK